MASTCKITKSSQVLGTGSVTGGSGSVTSFTFAEGVSRIRGRFICVEITEAGTHLARTFWTRVSDDNGSGTLTLRDACPFVGA
jgi:predicted O-methyltransferase YrrM